MSQVDVTLLAIAAALFGVLAVHRLTLWRSRRDATRLTVHAYKAAFADCSAAIANNSYAIDTFSRDFDRHEAAVNAVRPLLPERYQRKLQKAWDEYCGNGTDLGLDAREYVQATSAVITCADSSLFNDFKERFNALQGCLDGLL